MIAFPSHIFSNSFAPALRFNIYCGCLQQTEALRAVEGRRTQETRAMPRSSLTSSRTREFSSKDAEASKRGHRCSGQQNGVCGKYVTSSQPNCIILAFLGELKIFSYSQVNKFFLDLFRQQGLGLEFLTQVATKFPEHRFY